MTTSIGICGQPLVHALGWTLLHFCWQGALVAALLWCVLNLRGGWPSKARYGMACLALGLMVAFPLATFAHIASTEYRVRSAFDGAAIAIDPGITLRVGAGDRNAPWPARVAVALDHALPWILLAWCAGVLFFVGRLNVGLMVARRMKLAGTTAVSAELQQGFDALRRLLGIARAVRLMHSALIQVPAVIGWLRPVVLIPASCLTGLSAMQIDAILAHELAHIRRHDYLVSVLQSVVEALLFYHPAVWWVSKQVRRERECCCDELAVTLAGDPQTYARALLLLAERGVQPPEFALGANGGVLTMRIKRLLGCKENSAASQLASIVLLAVLVLAAGATIGTLTHAQNATAQTTSSASSTAQVAVEPDATQSAVASTATGPANGPPPSLSTAGQRRTPSDTEQQIENALQDTQRQVQDTQKNLNSEQFKKQLQDAQQQLQDAQKNLNSEQLKKQLQNAQKYLNSDQLKKQLQDAQKNLNSEQLKKQMQDSLRQFQDAQKTLMNSEQFKKQMQDSLRQFQDAQKTLNSEQLKKQIAQLLAQNEAAGHESAVPPAPIPSSAPAAPDGPVPVPAGAIQGNLIHKVDPVYPPTAKAAHVQGVVVLRATISRDGTIKNLSVVSGSQMLRTSAMDAVRQWKYKPYTVNGKPAEVETTVSIHFALDDSITGASPGMPTDEANAGVQRVGGDVTAPIPIDQPEPEYTKLARQDKVEGVVLISMVVDERGLPQQVHVVRGLGDGLDKTAVEDVQHYRFKPAMKDGKPVPVWLNIEINFKIF